VASTEEPAVFWPESLAGFIRELAAPAREAGPAGSISTAREPGS
jgi:hypothetical protein